MRRTIWFLCGVLLWSIASLNAEQITAQTSPVTAANQQKQTPCRDSKEFRAFDFWAGDWTVEVNGKHAGNSSVQIILDDCVLLENWTGAGGYSGKSFNIYNSAIKKWQQLWVDNLGGVLILTGELKDGIMKYSGETPQQDGSLMKERLTFYPMPDRKVRQVWEQSTDGLKWRTVFDGLYTPKK